LKKLVILTVVAALVVALANGTATAKQNGKNRATYNFRGTVQEVAGDSYLLVDVTGGNGRAREHLGLQQFGVTTDTKIEVNEEDAELADLVPGDEVKVQSKAAKDANEFAARKLSVEAEDDDEDK
jgi:hypothetical protein